MKQIRLTLEIKRFRETVDGKTYEYELPSLIANIPDDQVESFEAQVRAERRARNRQEKKK